MLKTVETKEGTSTEILEYLASLLKEGKPVVALIAAEKIIILKQHGGEDDKSGS